MHAHFANKQARLAVIGLAIVLIVVIAWIVEHGGRPIWTRDSGSLRIAAFIHGSPGAYRINDDASGSIGTIRYFRFVQSLDDRLIATEALDCRKLTVRFNDSPWPTSPSTYLRWRAFLHFAQPAIVLGDTDGVRTMWFGYPDELLMLAAIMLGCGAGALALIRLTHWAADALEQASDPYVRRLLSLRRGRCPHCKYDTAAIRAFGMRVYWSQPSLSRAPCMEASSFTAILRRWLRHTCFISRRITHLWMATSALRHMLQASSLTSTASH